MHIRDFEKKDFEQVANIYTYSFNDKFNRIIKTVPEERRPHLIMKSGILYPDHFPGYIVGEVNDRIIAVMLLRWKNQVLPKTEGGYFKSLHFGFLNVNRLFIGINALSSTPRKNECYVDFIAVTPEYQDIGLGANLLKHGMKYAKNKGFKELTLFVSSKNERANYLYKKLGFEKIKTLTSVTTKVLFGIKKWYFMSKKL